MLIAEMYFRVKTDTVEHNRQVFSLMDWLGSIGGIEEILNKVCIFFFGGFLQFNAVISTLNALSVHEHDHTKSNDPHAIENEI